MLLILFVLILAVLAWITLKPVWLPPPPENQVTATLSKNASQVAAATKTVTGTVAGATGNWLNRLKSPFQTRSAAGKQLKAWAGEAELAQKTALYKSLSEEAAGLSTRLASLSDEQAARFANELAAFCRTQNMELAWLFDATVDVEMKTALEEIVMLYSLAVWKGSSAQPLAVLQSWQAAPHQKENRAFAQKLFARLVAAGLASAPGELLLASDKEREAHVVKAIRLAAAQNHAAVLALVVELLSDENAGKPGKTQSPKNTPKPAPPAESPSETEQAIVAASNP
ncbi:MAG: hypothetical protein HY784_16860 [Chloroflexi bacterium]|nr:hypothetical protein [Chloroflexota bacterium]